MYSRKKQLSNHSKRASETKKAKCVARKTPFPHVLPPTTWKRRIHSNYRMQVKQRKQTTFLEESAKTRKHFRQKRKWNLEKHSVRLDCFGVCKFWVVPEHWDKFTCETTGERFCLRLKSFLILFCLDVENNAADQFKQIWTNKNCHGCSLKCDTRSQDAS